MSNNFIVLTKNKILRSIFAITLIGIALYSIYFHSNYNILETSNSTRLLPIYSIETKENKVALTFDCAWGADDIPNIIDILNKNNVKATFFAVGDWVTKNSATVLKLNNSGMEIR